MSSSLPTTLVTEWCTFTWPLIHWVALAADGVHRPADGPVGGAQALGATGPEQGVVVGVVLDVEPDARHRDREGRAGEDPQPPGPGDEEQRVGGEVPPADQERLALDAPVGAVERGPVEALLDRGVELDAERALLGDRRSG